MNKIVLAVLGFCAILFLACADNSLPEFPKFVGESSSSTESSSSAESSSSSEASSSSVVEIMVCGINPQKDYNPDLYECKTGKNGIYLKNNKPKDLAGKEYEAVLIGAQTWMAENLNYNVPSSKCYAEGVSGVSADSIAKNCDTYGRLYNWATAMGIDAKYNSQSWGGSDVKHKGVCPTGWHLPSDAEWTTLVGGSSTAGTKLKATTGWNSYSGVPAGTDAYGFSALPGGYGYSGGDFGYVGNYGNWWSASENGSNGAYRRYMTYNSESAGWNINNKNTLFSVRCVQD